MNDKVIGILGGMGPEATANFYFKLINATRVERDQDHFRVIMDSNPKIPDRTLAILGQGESPVAEMIRAGKTLERAGVDIACIPCITAHYFFEEVERSLSIPLINAFEALRAYIEDYYPRVKKIGVLSTTGTMRTGLFADYLHEHEVIHPEPLVQERKVMEAIYGARGIKSGYRDVALVEMLKEAAQSLIKEGVEIIIAGCTEIPLVLRQEHLTVPLIDPMDVVIKKILE